MKISDELLEYLGCFYLNRPHLTERMTFIEFIMLWKKGEIK